MFSVFSISQLNLISVAGCGRYAGGQGYNSIGHFCGGWAGNCGDGGIGGSTWYLVCDRCREKYLREKQTAAREKVKTLKLTHYQLFFFFLTRYWFLSLVEPIPICIFLTRWSSQEKNHCRWRPQGHCPLWRLTKWSGQTLCSCCPSVALQSPACCATILPGPCIHICFPALRKACRMKSPIKWVVSTFKHWQGSLHNSVNYVLPFIGKKTL